jgi:hypothetical protein
MNWSAIKPGTPTCMWKTKAHNVSETGSVSVLKWMGQDKPTQLGPLERGSLRNVVVFCLPHTRRWIESETSPIALYNIHHRQNPFKSVRDTELRSRRLTTCVVMWPCSTAWSWYVMDILVNFTYVSLLSSSSSSSSSFYSPLVGIGRFFSFLIPYTVGRTPRTGDQPVAKPLPIPRTTQTYDKHT